MSAYLTRISIRSMPLSSESYEFFSELTSLLPALECPKSESEFIRGFCDCWWQQVRFCWQFQNSQRSPESWSALRCRPFTSFVFVRTLVWYLNQPASFPFERDFFHSPFNRFKMSLRARRWPRPWFFFANVLYTTGRTPRLLCRENPRSIIQSVALSLGCPFKLFRVPIWHVFSLSLWCPRFWSAKRGDASWCLIRRFFFSLGDLLVER